MTNEVMITKPGKMVTYGEGIRPVNSHNPLKMWSRGKLKILYLYYQNVFDHKDFQRVMKYHKDLNLKFIPKP